MRIPIFGILFLLLPILEIAGIIIVGNAIGLWATLGLLLGTSVLGILILRMNAVKMASDLKRAETQSSDPQINMITGSMRSLGGILLILPGFICKTIGIAFLLPPLQKLLWSVLGRKMTVFRSGSAGGFQYSTQRPQQQSRSQPTIVDLDDADFERQPNEKSPWYGDKNGDDQKRLD